MVAAWGQEGSVPMYTMWKFPDLSRDPAIGPDSNLGFYSGVIIRRGSKRNIGSLSGSTETCLVLNWKHYRCKEVPHWPLFARVPYLLRVVCFGKPPLSLYPSSSGHSFWHFLLSLFFLNTSFSSAPSVGTTSSRCLLWSSQRELVGCISCNFLWQPTCLCYSIYRITVILRQKKVGEDVKITILKPQPQKHLF